MTLREYWFSLSRPEQAAFISRVDTTKGVLAALRCGMKRPGVHMALRIHLASDGRIPLHTLRPDVWQKEDKAA